MLETEKIAYIQRLYEKYAESLWGYAYYLSENKELADDTVQTVFLNMIKHASTLKNIQEEPKLKAYLNTATRNTFYNMAKEEQQYKNNLPYDEMEKEASTENPYQELETTDFIHSMMKTLSQREQDLLSLYYFVGLSIKETAQVMHLSVTNTKVTLHNIRKKLKKQFDKNDGTFYEEKI